MRLRLVALILSVLVAACTDQIPATTMPSIQSRVGSTATPMQSTSDPCPNAYFEPYLRGDGRFQSRVGHLQLRYPKGWFEIEECLERPEGAEWVNLYRFRPGRGHPNNVQFEIYTYPVEPGLGVLRCSKRPEPGTDEILPVECGFVRLAGRRWLRELFDNARTGYQLLHWGRFGGFGYRLAAHFQRGTIGENLVKDILDSVRVARSGRRE